MGLSAYDATVLAGDAGATALFEGARAASPGLPAKKLANWVIGEYLRLASRDRVRAGELAALVGMVEGGALSGTNAKEVFVRHASTGEGVAAIVAELGLAQISDEGALRAAIDAVFAANPDAVADVRAGKAQAIGFLTGQVMKRTRGQANAAEVQRLLRQVLDG